MAALPVGDIRFHAQQCTLQLAGGLIRRHRQDIDGQHQIAVKVAEFRHKAVLDVAGVVLQIQHPTITGIQLEMVGGKLHAVRAEPVLVLTFLSCVAGAVCIVACVGLSLLAILCLLAGQTVGCIAMFVLAFLVSPFGLPALGGWLVERLHGVKYAAMDFMAS